MLLIPEVLSLLRCTLSHNLGGTTTMTPWHYLLSHWSLWWQKRRPFHRCNITNFTLSDFEFGSVVHTIWMIILSSCINPHLFICSYLSMALCIRCRELILGRLLVHVGRSLSRKAVPTDMTHSWRGTECVCVCVCVCVTSGHLHCTIVGDRGHHWTLGGLPADRSSQA